VTGVAQYVENKPNIGNILVGVGKMMNNEHMSPAEVMQMKKALQNDDTYENFMGCFKRSL
jgi:hypothetical protein